MKGRASALMRADALSLLGILMALVVSGCATVDTPVPSPTPTQQEGATATRQPTRTSTPRATVAPTPEPIAPRDPVAANPLEIDPFGMLYFVHDGDIFLINPDGSGEIAVTQGGDYLSASWSPDTEHLAATRSLSTGGSTGQTTTQVVLLALDGSEPIVAAEVQGLASFHGWDPNGEAVVYALHSERDWIQGQIWITNTAGDSERLTEPGTANCCAMWSPDGQHLAYLTVVDSDANGVVDWWDSAEVWLLELASRETVRPAEDAEFYQHFIDGALHWSPDGTRLLYETRGNPFSIRHPAEREDYHIVSIDVTGGRQTTLLPYETLESLLRPSSLRILARDIALSPDGSRLGFVLSHAPVGGGGLVVVADADGSSVVARDLVEGHLNEVSWMPTDPESLVFFDRFRPDGRHVYSQLNVETGEVTKLFDGESGKPGSLLWSPDGTLVASWQDVVEEDVQRFAILVGNVANPHYTWSSNTITFDGTLGAGGWCC